KSPTVDPILLQCVLCGYFHCNENACRCECHPDARWEEPCLAHTRCRRECRSTVNSPRRREVAQSDRIKHMKLNSVSISDNHAGFPAGQRLVLEGRNAAMNQRAT